MSTITLPPNPRINQARAATSAYNAALKGHDESIVPAPPDDLIERVFENCPEMKRYKSAARVERLDYYIDGQWFWCWCITIKV